MTISPGDPKSLLPQTIIDGQSDEEQDEHERLREEQPVESLEEFLHGMFGAEDAAVDGGSVPAMFWLKDKFKTKSAIIRYLFQERGLTVKEISKHTGFLYQQCRNVLTNELKRGPNESFVLGKDDQIIKSLVPLLPKKKD